MMNYYFKLQVTRASRFFRDQGIHPWLGAILACALFISSAFYAKSQLEYAEWYIALIGISVVMKSSNEIRIQFLEGIFQTKSLRPIRLIEQHLFALPFLLFLIASSDWLPAACLYLATVLSAFMVVSNKTRKGIPTPFAKNPFEYIVGFRKTWIVFPFAMLVLLLGWKEENGGLAIASIAIVALVSMSFGYKPEVPEYIWMHSKSPKQFLLHKLKNTVLQAQILLLPFTITSVLLFPDFGLVATIVHLMCTLFLVTLVLAKYAAYPYEINVSQSMLLGLCLWFPPLFIAVLPKFFLDGIKKLTPLLHD
ncbi:MAG: hypothetical protein ACJAQ5_002561 [Flavobacteriales bacterium]|jgi:hypothetical protein